MDDKHMVKKMKGPVVPETEGDAEDDDDEIDTDQDDDIPMAGEKGSFPFALSDAKALYATMGGCTCTLDDSTISEIIQECSSETDIDDFKQAVLELMLSVQNPNDAATSMANEDTAIPTDPLRPRIELVAVGDLPQSPSGDAPSGDDASQEESQDRSSELTPRNDEYPQNFPIHQIFSRQREVETIAEMIARQNQESTDQATHILHQMQDGFSMYGISSQAIIFSRRIIIMRAGGKKKFGFRKYILFSHEVTDRIGGILGVFSDAPRSGISCYNPGAPADRKAIGSLWKWLTSPKEFSDREGLSDDPDSDQFSALPIFIPEAIRQGHERGDLIVTVRRAMSQDGWNPPEGTSDANVYDLQPPSYSADDLDDIDI